MLEAVSTVGKRGLVQVLAAIRLDVGRAVVMMKKSGQYHWYSL